MRSIDVTGQKFGSLTVTCRSDRASSAGALWDCKCDCGGRTTTTSLKLRSGHTRSCGCRRVEISGTINKIHGMANKTRTYKTWKEMRQRCMNKNKDNFQWYGGKGIKICSQWDSYDQFLADMGERPVGMTLDRIDSDGDYAPDNCRWATPKQQAETNRGCFSFQGARSFEKTKGVAR